MFLQCSGVYRLAASIVFSLFQLTPLSLSLFAAADTEGEGAAVAASLSFFFFLSSFSSTAAVRSFESQP